MFSCIDPTGQKASESTDSKKSMPSFLVESPTAIQPLCMRIQTNSQDPVLLCQRSVKNVTVDAVRRKLLLRNMTFLQNP